MKWFLDSDGTRNGVRQPYRVLERHPDLAHVEPSLQVMCVYSLCNPTWWPNYFDHRFNHVSLPKGVEPLDWRRDAYAFHFTHPTPTGLKTHKAALNGDGMFAKMGRMILEEASMIKHLQ